MICPIFNNYTSPNFNARFIKKTDILKLNSENLYSKAHASIVELTPDCTQDILSLEKTANEWHDLGAENLGTYASDILYDFQKPPQTKFLSRFFFALTNQKKDFQCLNSEDILCLSQLETRLDGFHTRIKWLQANPYYNYETDTPRLYKNLGKTIVDYFKEIVNGDIWVNADPNAIDFYKKQGFFAPFDTSKSCMVFSKSKKDF